MTHTHPSAVGQKSISSSTIFHLTFAAELTFNIFNCSSLFLSFLHAMTHDNDRNTTELQDMPQSSRLQPLSTRTSPSPNSASTPRTSVSNNHDQTSSQNKTPQDSENIVKVNNDSQTEDGILQNKRQSSYFVQQEGDDLSNGDIVPGDGKALVKLAIFTL